jgi:hypothetical protein
MKAIIEHLIVAVIAVVMAFVGYLLMGEYGSGKQNFIELHDIGWTVWSSAVSVATWFYLYRMCRNLHWLVLPDHGSFESDHRSYFVCHSLSVGTVRDYL